MALTNDELKMIWQLIKYSRMFSEPKFDLLSAMMDTLIEKPEKEFIKLFLAVDMMRAMQGEGEEDP